MPQLKHCPFCGGQVRLRPITAWGMRLIYACCSRCGAMSHGVRWGAPTGKSTAYISKEEAIKVAINEWNQIVEEMLQ